MTKYSNNFLAHALSVASLGREDAPFLFFGDEFQSYADFFENAEKLANVLVEHGIQPGDRVAVQVPKARAMLELYFATVLAGAVFLPLNPAYTVPEVSYFLNDATPTIFICDPKKLDDLQKIADLARVASVLTLAADESGSLTQKRDASQAGFIAITRRADELAAILYTSGTTGRSKGAMLTHGSLASNSQTLLKCWGFTASDVLIHALPIFHTHGLFVATNISLMSGSACIFMNGFDADAIIDAMPKATVLMGVPTFYVRLLKQKLLARATKGMRLFVSGSAPLLRETHERWSKITGHVILERYGMTETNMNTTNPYVGERRPGTVGFALPGVELKVCNPVTGELLENGEVGILEVRGPNLFQGYWNMPEKTAEELRDNGFFITGDLGMIDADGYLHIVGREKDLIISGGLNIYPKEVETLIDDLDGVIESAVVGVPHSDFGEAVIALVVSKTLRSSDVIDALVGNIAPYKQPKKVLIVETLPRNTMGKVQKAELRSHYKDILL